MKILLTGAAGYLGSAIVRKLLDFGFEVIAYDNLMYGQSSLLAYADHPKFKFVFGDVENNTTEYQKLCSAVDFILPLACIVGAPASTREEMKSFAVNWRSIASLVENCKYDSNPRIIFPTTNSGYGTKSGEVVCTEETPLEPISNYGIQKVNAENFLLDHYENVITLRLATVFGCSPRMRLDLLVNYTVWKAITDRVICVPEDMRNNIRNYVHIQDVVDCFLFCMENFEIMKGNAYNLGNDSENRSVWDLSSLIASQVGCELLVTHHYKDPDKRNYIVSNEKLRKVGFEAMRTISKEVPNIVKVCNMIKMMNYGRSEYRNA